MPLARSRSFAPEIVLCDIAMPGMDGYMVARAMRADPHLHSIHLVAVSGFSQPDDVERSRQAGFARHEAKPLALARLMSVLAEAPSARLTAEAGRADSPQS